MILNEIFQRFIENRPFPVMARSLLEHVIKPERLDAWFEKKSQKQYTRELLFSSVFNVMSLVVFKTFTSVHAAYQAMPKQIGVSVTSVYNKLNGIDAQTSGALVRDIAADLAEIIEGLKGSCSAWIPGYRIKILDGNCIEASEHRLGVLRDTAAGPLPGKSLVVFDPSLEMAIDVFPCEDGHAQERSLLGAVVSTVQADDIMVMDRNFSVLGFLVGIEDRDGYFICRQHQGLPFTALGPERLVGSIENGKVYEQSIEIVPADGGKARKCRRIRVQLKRPTRDGEKQLFIISNLSKTAAHAKLIAEIYRRRWRIETMFQELEAHLHSEVNSLGYPKAALFAFCVALVSYNVLAVVKSALRRVHGEETISQKVSGYYISGELARSYDGMMTALPPKFWSQFQRVPRDKFLEFLMTIAKAVDLTLYRKHKRGPKKPQTKRTKDANKPHVSTAKLLHEQKSSN